MNRKRKFTSKNTSVHRERKESSHYVTGVMAENRRLKEEKEELLKMIADLQQNYYSPVEEHHLYVERDDHVVLDPQLEPDQKLQRWLALVACAREAGSGEKLQPATFIGVSLYGTKMHNNDTAEFTDDEETDLEIACEGLLELSNSNRWPGGGSPEDDGGAAAAAAATLVSFSM